MPARPSTDNHPAPDTPDSSIDSSGDSSVAYLHAVLDQLIAAHGSAAHTEAISAARQDYDERRGRVFEDEELWESFTQAFLEWYVVERPQGDDGAPPAAHALARLAAGQESGQGREPGPGQAADSERRRAALRAWLTSYRSLFEVRGLRAGQVELVDLLGGGQFSVDEQRALAGVSVGDVAELRLVGFEDRVRFGKTFCYHPAGTRDAIVARARRMADAGQSRREIMDVCALLRVRCERYRHVSPVRVYESAPATVGRASGPMAAVTSDAAEPASSTMGAAGTSGGASGTSGEDAAS